jgi:NPCBM/NEW2 domain
MRRRATAVISVVAVLLGASGASSVGASSDLGGMTSVRMFDGGAGSSTVSSLPLPGARFAPEAMNGVTPARLLDTRDGTGAPVGAVGQGGSLDLQVTGRGGVPASGVSAVVLNVTVTDPTSAGFITVWPTGVVRPTASNLNFTPGQTVPNLVVVKLGVGGSVSLFNSAGSTHLVADVTGWYADGSQFVPITPQRLLDTRSGLGGVQGPTHGAVDVVVLGQAGVPTTGVTAVVINVLVTEPTGTGYLTVWPKGFPQPTASSLNYVPGRTVPNLVYAKIGQEGKISYFNNAGTTHVAMDVFGYITGPANLTELLDPVDSDAGFSEGAYPVQGQLRFNSVRINQPCLVSMPQWVEYNLGRSWKTLATTISFDDVLGTAASKIRFRILGDGVQLVDQTLSFGQSFNVTSSMDNVLRVRFEVTNVSGNLCSYGAVFAEPRLSTQPSAPFPAAAEFTPLVPSRILDTRSGTGAGLGPVSQGGVLEVQTLGRAGVPVSGVGAVVVNLTVTEPSAGGYITVWPTGVTQPLASSANFRAGDTNAVTVVVPVGPQGRISLFNSAGSTHLIADVLGWFPGSASSASSSANLTELLDPVDSDAGFSEGAYPVQGQLRFNSLRINQPCLVSMPQWVEYNLGRSWKTLATTISFDDVLGTAASKIRFRILGDGVQLVDQTLSFGQSFNVTSSMDNVLRVRFEVTNVSGNLCSYGAVFASPTLSRG